jgi:type IV pilus assembly protein PilQ
MGAHSLPSRSLNAVGATADNPAPTAITASLLDNNLQIAIANIMSDAATEVLASPQVSTLDNTEAVVYMGDKISIRVIDDSGESSTQLVEAGIKLTVTPHVSGDNRILLDLHPQNDSYGYDTQGQVVISTQEAKTKVVVADGETVVIGGLTRNENTQSETGVPFLKDIPLLGNLFKYTRNQVEKRDLIIFVTPRLIRNYIGDVELSEPSMATPELVEKEPPATGKLPSDQKVAPAAKPAPQAAPAAKSAPAKAPAAPEVEEVEDWN